MDRARYLKHYGNTLGVTKVMLTLEMALAFALIALSVSIFPFNVPVDWADAASSFFTLGWSEMSSQSQWMLVCTYGAAVFLLMPFYSAAGFGVYINARSILEGWDIELAFRRLGQRVSKLTAPSPGMGKVASLIGIAAFTLSFADVGNANPDPNEAIEEVMSSPEFDIEVLEYERREVDPSSYEFDSPSGSVPSGLGDALYYGFIVALCVGAVLLIWFNRHAFMGRGKLDLDSSKARTVMGMEVSKESLPEDIIRAAREAWAAGEFSKAISLLYRGAICWLVENGGVDIEESDTENECLVRTEKKLPESNQLSRFSNLTECWILQAYGGITPEENVFHSLCENWPFSLKAISDGNLQPSTEK